MSALVKAPGARCGAPRRRRRRTSSRIPSFARDARLSRRAGQAGWLRCSLLTCRPRVFLVARALPAGLGA